MTKVVAVTYVADAAVGREWVVVVVSLSLSPSSAVSVADSMVALATIAAGTIVADSIESVSLAALSYL